MDRKIIRELTHKAGSALTLDNSIYKQWVFRYTFLELEKDLGAKGDITTKAIFSEQLKATAKVLAKSDGVFAGKDEVHYFLVDADPNFRPGIRGEFKVKFNFDDGREFKEGDVLLEIEADVHDLLAVERVLLNLIMRMTAVATFSRKLTGLVKECGVLITPTRKTLWGLIDKKAVLIGGGGTHRLGLHDAFLVKDTHLDLIGRDFEKAIGNILDSGIEGKFLEIEVENKEEALRAAETLYKFMEGKLRMISVLLLDNMTPVEVKETVDAIRTAGYYENLLFEASGGINETNVVEYAKTGVDILSMGCLTAGVKGVDMSMKIV